MRANGPNSQTAEIFPESPGTGDRSRRYSEPGYSYLHRSSRREATQVRALVSSWYENYPSEQRARFARRFCVEDDSGHLATFFELYVHELVSRLDSTPEIHESDDSATRKPDFFCPGTSPSWIEVTLATEASHERSADKRARDQFLDVVADRLNTGDIYFHVDDDGARSSTPSARKLANDLNAWSRELDADDLVRTRTRGGILALPSRTFALNGMRLAFTADAWSPRMRGRPDLTAFGMRGDGGERNRERAIANVLRAKAGRYGDLQISYVIALNVSNERGVEDWEFDLAIFGNSEIAGPFDDSLWRTGTSNRNTRVSAVLVTSGVGPWSVAAYDLWLYENPNAAYPYKGPLQQLTRRIIGPDGFPRTIAGIHPRQVFKLPKVWPTRESRKP